MGDSVEGQSAGSRHKKGDNEDRGTQQSAAIVRPALALDCSGLVLEGSPTGWGQPILPSQAAPSPLQGTAHGCGEESRTVRESI